MFAVLNPARRSGLTVLALAMIAALLTAIPANAAPVPAGWTYQDAWFTSHDGIQMHAGVFLPADRAADEKHPVLMNIGPYTAPNGGATSAPAFNLDGIVNRNPELFTHPGMAAGRYAYLQV